MKLAIIESTVAPYQNLKTVDTWNPMYLLLPKYLLPKMCHICSSNNLVLPRARSGVSGDDPIEFRDKNLLHTITREI